MSGILIIILYTFTQIASLLYWVLIAYIIISWLFIFNIGTNSRAMQTIAMILNSVVEPMLEPFRGRFTRIGMLDLSPIALFLSIQIIRVLIIQLIHQVQGY